MEAGIIGLSYVGKTTLFNALTALGVGTAAGAKPNIGMVKVPDPRLALLNKFIETQKIVPADIQLVDVAGLVSGSSQGKGTGNKFLAHLRNVDALLHVVRCFEDPDVPHIHDSVDPVRDVEEVETELAIADLEVVENSIKNTERKARTGDKEQKNRLVLLQKCADALGQGTPISAAGLTTEQLHELKSYALLTAKPVLYVANIAENDLSAQSPLVKKLEAYAVKRGILVVSTCCKLEAELSELPESERGEMLAGMGLSEPALAVVARAAYKVLGLQSFFTAGPKEIKAWTIRIGAPAPEAAGVIHSDIQRGFIRAEIYSVGDLEKFKTETAIKHAGKMRVEGKDYVMQDGDVCHFLFNV